MEDDTQQTPTATTEPEAAPKTVFTLPILEIVRKGQMQNGLRNEDYMRYRQYCSRRLGRLRKSIKVGPSSKKRTFTALKLTEEQVTDARVLLVPLIDAERCWAYAKFLKGFEGGRISYHMQRRLRKAIIHSSLLLRLCKAKADERTCVEAEAYHDWMSGTEAYERGEWEIASNCFRRTRSVYDKLARLESSSEKAELYRQRVEDLDPIIRFCRYNLTREGGQVDDADLVGEGVGEDMVREALEHSLKRQTANMETVTWRGKQVVVGHDKVRVCLLEANALSTKARDTSIESSKRFNHFDKLFMALNDALSHIRSEMILLMNEKPVGHQVREEQLNHVTAHVTHCLLVHTVYRNRALVDDLRSKMEMQANVTTTSKNRYAAGKPVTPEEIANVCERLIQNMHEFKSLPGYDSDTAEQRQVEIGQSVFKGMRCYFLALSYNAADKWVEAVALFKRASDYVEQAKQLSSDLKPNTTTIIDLNDIDWVEQVTRAGVSVSRAMALLQTLQTDQQLGQDLALISLARSQSKHNVPLLDRINECKVDTQSAAPFVIDFPPSLTPIPVKPVLFDLASDHIEHPDLTPRKPKGKKFFGLF
eukprot:c5126_g1_i1.p1 GENE.c5126_g1_i1~~c5126_g1_i1.p1  ORF type:complete len:603 (+),score=146.17 c5126_g1_i1:37-1809(+)